MVKFMGLVRFILNLMVQTEIFFSLNLILMVLAWTRTLHSPTMASIIHDAEYAFTGDVDTSGNLSFAGTYFEDQSPYGVKNIGLIGKVDRNGNVSNLKKTRNYSTTVAAEDMVHLGNDTFAVMHRWNNVHMILLELNLTKSSTNPIYLTLADDRGMVMMVQTFI